MNYEIKPVDRSLINEMLEIEQQSFTDPWSKEMFFSSFENESVHFFGAFDGRSLCAFVVFSMLNFDDGGECEIYDIAVRPECRRQGLGSRLINTAFDFAVKHGARDFYLEVRSSNFPARMLYKSLGFAECGIRRNYYISPREDAVLMAKHQHQYFNE